MVSSWFHPPSSVMLYGHGTLKVREARVQLSVWAPMLQSVLPATRVSYLLAPRTRTQVAPHGAGLAREETEHRVGVWNHWRALTP
jgi:hypothetical protein